MAMRNPANILKDLRLVLANGSNGMEADYREGHEKGTPYLTVRFNSRCYNVAYFAKCRMFRVFDKGESGRENAKSGMLSRDRLIDFFRAMKFGVDHDGPERGKLAIQTAFPAMLDDDPAQNSEFDAPGPR